MEIVGNLKVIPTCGYKSLKFSFKALYCSRCTIRRVLCKCNSSVLKFGSTDGYRISN